MNNVWARSFSHFFREWSFKIRKNPRVDFFKARKDLKASKRRFSINCSWMFCSMDCLQPQFIRVGEAVSWTQRFVTRKIWPRNRSLFMTNRYESKCFQKFFVSSKYGKECYRKTTPYLEQPPCQHFPRRTTQQTFFAINLASRLTENNKALLFFSGKETIQTFNGSN